MATHTNRTKWFCWLLGAIGWGWFSVATDAKALDGFVGVITTALGGLSVGGRKVQNGYVRSYALTMVLGVLVVGAVLILGLAA